MTEIFKRPRVVQAWMAAARHLARQKRQHDRNIILEITSPQTFTADDREIVRLVDVALQRKNAARSVMTAAGTIFPQRIYQHYGRPEWYSKYQAIIARSKAKGTWGTYTLRMIHRVGPDGEVFNPLEKIIEKLSSRREANQTKYAAAYELSTIDPAEDFEDPTAGFGYELPTYDPATDRNSYMGSPCLSHVTFKLMDNKVDLTAIYRSHYYAERALGNLIGLAQLQNYVAREAGYEPGVLTCVSTYAKLDPGLGGIVAARDLLAALPADEPITAAKPAPAA